MAIILWFAEIVIKNMVVILKIGMIHCRSNVIEIILYVVEECKYELVLIIDDLVCVVVEVERVGGLIDVCILCREYIYEVAYEFGELFLDLEDFG